MRNDGSLGSAASMVSSKINRIAEEGLVPDNLQSLAESIKTVRVINYICVYSSTSVIVFNTRLVIDYMF